MFSLDFKLGLLNFFITFLSQNSILVAIRNNIKLDVAHPLVGAPSRLKTIILYNQSIDNSLLSCHKILSPTGQKMAELWPKIVCPYYGIIVIFRDFLAHNQAKYQYFSMRSSLFVSYYQITYCLLVVGQFLVKCGF